MSGECQPVRSAGRLSSLWGKLDNYKLSIIFTKHVLSRGRRMGPRREQMGAGGAVVGREERGSKYWVRHRGSVRGGGTEVEKREINFVTGDSTAGKSFKMINNNIENI